jgi:NhaA family Na+:H+ antiporter
MTPAAPDDLSTRERLFARLTPGNETAVLDVLRAERTGGVLLLLGALAALVLANTGASGWYAGLRSVVVGPSALHLDLSLGAWATDGLLAIFFFVVGLELKREVVVGDLRRPATAALPIVAAIGGMAAPALLYVVMNAGSPDGDLRGWAVPTATDIAFAVAVLAVVGRSLPNALRAFLLTLAVVDDLLAITVIAVFYSESISLWWLSFALLSVVAFGLAVRWGLHPAVLVVVGVVAWTAMHASGVHATIAGVLLGFAVPAALGPGGGPSVAERYEHSWRPFSAGFAVPVFAFFAAGVRLDPAALSAAAADPAAQGVAIGLVIGKPLGIALTTWSVSKLTRTPLADGLGWSDVVSIGFLAGIGFTVSLLIGELAFAHEPARDQNVRAAVLVASTVAAALGGSLLALRERHHRVGLGSTATASR